MFPQKEALVKLLQDNDPETLRLVKEQLTLAGESNLQHIQELVEIDDQIVSRHAREVLNEINRQNAFEEFSLLCHFFHDGVNLEHACWTLARALEPGLCTRSCENSLEDWGWQFRVRISERLEDHERVQLLSEFLSEELGFHGNSDDYYCERNSLLPHVIERRVGIPITLTILYMIVGARAAMKIEGINLPGHFIARHGSIFFDPFNDGLILTRRDIQGILSRQRLELKSSHFRAATSRQILVRVLANLLYVYDLCHDLEKRRQVHAWMTSLTSGA